MVYGDIGGCHLFVVLVFIYFGLFVDLCLSVSLRIHLFLSIYHALFLCACLFSSVSLFICVFLCCCCPFVFISFSLHVCFFPSIFSVSLSLSLLCFSPSLFVSVCLSVRLFICGSAYTTTLLGKNEKISFHFSLLFRPKQ